MSKRQRYLEFGKPVVHQRPPDATPGDLVEALNRAALGRDLPAGWDVEQRYRNSPRAGWKSVPVERMVRDSANRGGDFIGLYLRYLAHQADRLGVRHEEPRRATPAEVEAAERKLERISEREAGAFEVLTKKQKRSAAAKKREENKRQKKLEAERKKAETVAKRKRTIAAKKRAAKLAAAKRSAAAKQGWVTRRKNEAAAKRKRKRKR